MSLRGLIAVGLLMELCYLSFYCASDGAGQVLVLIAVNVVTYVLFALVARGMWKTPPEPGPEKWTLRVIIAMAVIFRVTLIPHGIVGSDDIYRYLWDGKVTASGINPYLYLPTDPHLAHLSTPDLPSKVNHPELRSVYPAVAQVFFVVSHTIFGESIAGLKALLVIVDCLTILVLLLLLRAQKIPSPRIILYAWSPLPILYFGLDGHIDALGILFLSLALFYLLTRRTVRGGIALGLSALVKLAPLIVVPLLLRLGKGIRGLLLPAVVGLVVAAGYAVFVDASGGFVESLRTFGSRWEFNGGVFSVVYFLTGSNEIAHVASAVEIVLWIGFLSLLRRPLLEKVFWGFAGFILLSPVVHPWYLTWIAALLVLRWSLSIFVFLGLSAIANVVVYQYRAYGQWSDQPLLLLLEYVPVFILLVAEIRRGEVLRPEPR